MTLTAQHITKEYPRKTKTANCITVLQPLDLTLEPGILTVLTGRSGSGKSTLLHILGGLLQPTSGTVLAGDNDLYAMTDSDLSCFRNQHIGIIPQGQSAVGSLTVLENVLLPVTLYGKAEERDIRRAKELLEETGIAALSDCLPAELSGGELRRMAAARAMLRQPEILLADEPTSDLDAENAAILWQMLRTAAQNGAAVLTVTHEQGADLHADRLYTMDYRRCRMLRKDTTEKYLKVIYDLTQQNRIVRACDIAEKMGFSRPTVCVMLRKLEAEGYIVYAGERVVILTELGSVTAERSAVRIRFFRSLLLQLGTPLKIAEQDAEQISSVLSAESYELIYAYVTARSGENKA